ncbi:MAG: hydroxymethylbilane synthase, partial [Nitrospinae bacterium]|nr:hydroxymethylbilane synthase [Nitrospinota bacterium]
MMTKNIRIGSRGSLLALNQANLIKVIIEKGEPDLRAEIIIIKTTGDKILDVPLAKVGGKGLFVKEIEDALIDNRIDIAVHSMKDVPFLIPDQLIIQAITKREDPRDILISKEGLKIDELPKGARIGTSSLRRQAQLLHHRPDLQISQLRGNLDTRIKKAFTPEFDAVILAAAGLHRMGWEEKITE